MEFVYYTNGTASLLAAGGLAYIVLSQRIEEGLFIKFGLVCMIFGLLMTGYFVFADIESMRGLWISGMLLRVGLCFAIVGYWIKRLKTGHNCFRATDWKRRFE